ncbi:hypothetical protein KL905_002337 [Ogataea polymorpha]|uniref:Small ribosomal subunit protein mS33 n=1 Tax=Ogataea polymorpha TaxID=460523 RepID=A0A1B7SD69_9ASCO|nr:uncharacterized protein OGAPODRAFT_17185 [Ogataea polymorpha]KAG7880794.1 hypothetical protein KL937_001641 [Ogataea polymorpha]KAG7890059.1 hypothetical protein KL936_002733 [Ogataea polymorpha]KAG7893535.1 hypothetical protein KL908_002589 [Ogataea polymorpha]KAG7901157.1 hypothetical protein KL935_002223 [Ogataea polymorpha]KAG7905510.1 hypothetical protein KL907_002657 [Ogataea polymorpha]
MASRLFNPPKLAKLKELTKLQCNIFRTTYNPQRLRTEAQILRKPLKGQIISNYYGPADFPTVFQIFKLWRVDDFRLVDEDEDYRQRRVRMLRKRGKGAPKKLKTPSEAPTKKRK